MILLADQASFNGQEAIGLLLAAFFGGIFFWTWARVRQAERKQREHAEQVERLFLDSPVGMAIVSLEGYWLRVNPALQKILGYEDSEFNGMTWMDFTLPEDVQTDQGLVERCIRGEIKTYKMAKRYRHKDGRTVYAMLVVSAVRGDDGKPMYFQSQVQDVSSMIGIQYHEAPCPQGNHTCALREVSSSRALVIRFPDLLEVS